MAVEHSAKTSGCLLEPVYKAVFNAIASDSEKHGKNIILPPNLCRDLSLVPTNFKKYTNYKIRGYMNLSRFEYKVAIYGTTSKLNVRIVVFCMKTAFG